MIYYKDKFKSGPADIICILKLPNGKLYAAFLEEYYFPPPAENLSERNFVRLVTKLLMKEVGTLEKAKDQVRKLRKQTELPDNNVLDDVAIEATSHDVSWFVPNWTTGKISLKQAIIERHIL